MRVWTLGKIWEDLSLAVTADGLGGGTLSVTVIMISVAQAVQCYVVYFHANNYKHSNKLLLQIRNYFVVYFSLITIQRICGKDSYSCQTQVECSSRQHFNTHAIRSPRVLTFRMSFCTQRLITFQNVFDNVDIQLLCWQDTGNALSIFHWQVCKVWYMEALSSWKKTTAYHKVFRHSRHKLSSKILIFWESIFISIDTKVPTAQ